MSATPMTFRGTKTVVSTDQYRDDAGGGSDESLLAAIVDRADRTAFADLFGRYAGRIKAFLINGRLDPGTAEEIAQEVMVTLWRKAASFDPSKASVATWIFTIARNRRIDHLRRQARPEPDPTDPQFRPEPEVSSERAVANATRDTRVRAALASLADEQREVVQLAFFAGLSHGEIAERLGTPLGTVKSRLRLSFARLRTELGTEFVAELADD